MEHEPRFFEPSTLVEVTDVTIQNRYLLRPSDELNDIVVGVLGRAQRRYDMTICGVVVMSTHLHLLLVPEDPKHLADFMCHVKTNLSKEIGGLHDWPGKLWKGRYNMVPVSSEERAQVCRLEYLLSNSVKERLVDRVADWPGVHSAEALVQGQPLIGTWYDRTKEYLARQRQEDFDPEDFTTKEQLVFSPLPCWAHVASGEYRSRIAEIINRVDEEAMRERQRTGSMSLGVRRILRASPHKRPRRVERSPRPRFHAATRRVLREMREAYG